MTEDRNRVDRRAPDETAPEPATDDIASILTGETLSDDELDDLCEATLATVGSAKTQK